MINALQAYVDIRAAYALRRRSKDAQNLWQNKCFIHFNVGRAS